MARHSKSGAATSPSAPFKGESFPSSVLQRVPRSSSGCCSSLQQNGPPLGSVVATTSAKLAPSSMYSSPSSSASRHLQTAASPSALSITTRSRAPQLTLTSSLSPQLDCSSSSSPSTRTRSFQRPSLSDQLKSISQDITGHHFAAQDHLQASTRCSRTTGLPAVSIASELQATTIGMSAGKLECRFPCPVHFRDDHCAYLFQHSFETKEIHMVMFYRDMTQVSVSLRDKSFQFRITHALEHFGDDYKPPNPQHVVRIVLATISETQRVKQFVAEHRHWFAS